MGERAIDGAAAASDRTLRLRNGATAGFCGVATATGLLSLVNLVFPAVPFPPLQIAQAFVRATPGGIATFAIDTLGKLALPATAFAVACAFVGLGAALGMLATRKRKEPGTWTWTLVMIPLWLGWFVLAPPATRAAHPGAHILAGLLGLAVSAAAAGRVHRRLGWSADPPAEGPARAADVPGDPTRRYLFVAGAAGFGGVALAMSGLSKVIRPASDPGNRPLALASVSPSAFRSPAAGDAAFDSIPLLAPEVTPLKDFYTIDEAIIDPTLDPQDWRLDVRGLVDRPGSLTLADLRSMPAVERPQTLACISNPVGGDLISTAIWVGVPVRNLLERSGADTSNAVEVVFRSADGYSDSLPFEQAMDPETLLALGMNGRTLPRSHGYPTRLLSTGTYGMKNPKWITSIEVVDAPYDGFWESRGWSKTAAVKTGARIDTHSDGDEVAGTTTIAGVAFAGDRGIARVEVSTDGGEFWADATLRSVLGPFTWRQWRYEWTAEQPGEHRIVARAIDGQGQVQSSEVAGPHPSGSSGLHAVVVTVV